MYEVWQSQCFDDDGVLDSGTIRRHPFPAPGEQRRRYVELGEVQFIAECASSAKRSIREQPHDFLNRIANRWMAACVYYMAYGPSEVRLVWPMRYKRCVFPLPFLSLLAILMLGPRPLRPEIVAAMLIYALVLLPYVLIGYYDRYAVPLVGVKMLIVLYGANCLMPVLKSGVRRVEAVWSRYGR
jgi:hypothetical protein